MKRSSAILALILAGYHAWRWKRSRPYPEPGPVTWAPDCDAPMVSFLVPVWNGASDIHDFVAGYRSLSYPNRELILCAGGEDHTYEIAQRSMTGDVIVIEQVRGDGKQGALRKCFPLSTGQFIYLTDIDCRLNDDTVHNLIQHVVSGHAEIVTGASRPLEDQMGNPFVVTQWAVEQATEHHELCAVDGILGRNAALTRTIVEATGAFATDVASGTDYALAKEAQREGYRILFAPGYPMPTVYPASVDVYIRKQTRWIRNVFVLGRQYGARREVWGSIATLVLPFGLLGAGALSMRPISGVRSCAGLAVSHGVLSRIGLQVRAGVQPHPANAVIHFFATQIAALHACHHLLTNRRVW